MMLKQITTLVLFFWIGISCYAQNPDFERIRTNYRLAVLDKKVCLEMIRELSASPRNSLQQGYLGAFQMIWAVHVFNPISKLRTFNRGKKKIDEAVMADPDNVEIRIIRLSIQTKSPSFLGYRDNIDEDKKIIQANHKSITSTVLRAVMVVLI